MILEESRALVARASVEWSGPAIELLAALVKLGPPGDVLAACRGGEPSWARSAALVAYRAVDQGRTLGAPHAPAGEPPPPHGAVSDWPAVAG